MMPSSNVCSFTVEPGRFITDLPWLYNPGQTSPEVQNRGISGPTKKTYILKNFFKKYKKKKVLIYRKQTLTQTALHAIYNIHTANSYPAKVTKIKE